MKNRKLLRILLTGVWLFFTVGIVAQDEANSVVRTMNDKDLQWGPCPEFMPDGCEIAVLRGDPAKKNVDILFKVPANSEIANHGHTSAERMILIAGDMEVTYEGEEPRQLKTGSYVFGPAKKPHSARCGDSGPCVLFIAFEEPLDAYAIQE
ncbi:cupin domain-containing protein [Salinimicrobium xinjiangense]|uniref:cupin domain-containing protein n=1 Tax=Salinimicrobium xinjiangense TaxID=438596 RepID=UPI000411CE25|nr:DUF4437 domain-containing protein [Salinimicrobium xinjiangense]